MKNSGDFRKYSGKSLLLLLLLSVAIASRAQPPGPTIQGIVKDEAGKTLPGATITLFQLPAGNLLQQKASNSNGSFEFQVSPGYYRVGSSFAGFLPFQSDTIRIPDNPAHRSQLTIILQPAIGTLQEVVVAAAKKKMEVKGNRIILDLQNSALAAGGSALDALKSLPGISIGQDDQLMLRGSTGLNVMIDGRMTFVSGKELTQLLTGTAAGNISKIELITSPSAEFDAAGNAGIIHIITRKNLRKGYALDIRTGISKGKYWMTNENITASIRTSTLNITGSFDYNTPHRYFKGESGNSIRQEDATTLIRRNNEVSYKIKYYTYQLGVSWQFLPHHQLMAGYSGYKDDFKALKFSAIKKYDLHHQLQSSSQTATSILEPYYYDAANLSYQFDLDTTGKKLTADAHYISYRNYSDGLMTTVAFDKEGRPAAEQQALLNRQPGFIKIQSYKVDAVLPFHQLTLQTGIKYSRVTNDNKYRFDSLVNGQFVEAVTMSDHFRYKEEIAAAYLSGSKKIGNTSVNIGLRVEHTLAHGLTVEKGISNKSEYTRFFPSFSVEHIIDGNHRIQLSASRRIERPAYSNLNPVRWYDDPYFLYAGNADLKPEMGWLLSSTYTFRQQYILLISYSRRTDYLSRRLLPEPGTKALISQMTNFPRLDRVDLNISIPHSLLPWWQLQFVAGLNYMRYPIQDHKKLSQWAGSIQVNQQIKLPGNLRFELVAYGYSNELMGIYQKQAMFFMDGGFRKSFLKNKLDARLSCTDLLGTNHYKAYAQSDQTDYHFHDRPDTRRVAISFTYHFGGKLHTGQTRRIEEQDRL